MTAAPDSAANEAGADRTKHLELTDVVGQRWRLALTPERLELRGDEGETTMLEPAQVDEILVLRHSVGAKPVMQLRLPERPLGFRLSDEDFRTVGHWLGRSRTARRAVGSYALIAVLCGALWILRSLPAGTDELTGEAIALDPASLLLGIIALGSGIAAKLRPFRGVLVADAAWCTGAAIDTGWRVYTGLSHGAWLIGSALLLALAWGQIRLFFLIGELPDVGGLGAKREDA